MLGLAEFIGGLMNFDANSAKTLLTGFRGIRYVHPRA
jgi:hypothetical protein